MDYRNVVSEEELVCLGSANKREAHPKTRLRDGISGVATLFRVDLIEIVSNHVSLDD